MGDISAASAGMGDVGGNSILNSALPSAPGVNTTGGANLPTPAIDPLALPDGQTIKGSSDTTPTNPMSPRRVYGALPPNDFQKFVAQATGDMLPLFGSDFFINSGNYVAPQAPVAKDYILGPGDQVMVRSSGTVDADYKATVERDGTINIPRVGKVLVAGTKASQLDDTIQRAMGKVFRGFSASATLGRLRGITVYMVGMTRAPGTYTVPSNSTLLSALFEAGGPNSYGSFRKVQLKRGNQKIAELDLYNFILQGDVSSDIRLTDGDVIVVPPANGYVAITGQIQSPAVFELKGGETLADLMGRLKLNADPHKAYIEHMDQDSKQPRSVEEIDLKNAAQIKLQHADLVSIRESVASYANAVVFHSTLRQGFRAPYKDGMRVTDIVPSREFLLLPSFTRSQEVGFDDKTAKLGAGYATQDVNWDYAVIERLDKKTMQTKLIPFNLGKALDAPGSSDDPPYSPMTL